MTCQHFCCSNKPTASILSEKAVKISHVILLCDRLQKQRREHRVMPRGLGCLASPEGADGRYETPPAAELHRLMWTKKGTSSHLDEVQPRIYIGDM